MPCLTIHRDTTSTSHEPPQGHGQIMVGPVRRWNRLYGNKRDGPGVCAHAQERITIIKKEIGYRAGVERFRAAFRASAWPVMNAQHRRFFAPRVSRKIVRLEISAGKFIGLNHRVEAIKIHRHRVSQFDDLAFVDLNPLLGLRRRGRGGGDRLRGCRILGRRTGTVNRLCYLTGRICGHAARRRRIEQCHQSDNGRHHRGHPTGDGPPVDPIDLASLRALLRHDPYCA